MENFGVHIVLLFLSIVVLVSSSELTTVSTPLGDVVGRVTDQPVVAFTGIPYAEAPVGDLRFRLPRSPVSWNSTFNATEMAKACPQLPVATLFSESFSSQGEDCLTLDIYVDGNNTNPETPMAVMIYIHGGGFFLGSSSPYRMLYFVGGRGIIAVVIQYRLGLLGFAQTPDDETIPGNLGLHDQVAAIKWVKKYISYFGGDPNAITLAGESAGSVSVAYHLVSPLSTGLFNRAIMQSGAHRTVEMNTEEKIADLMGKLIQRSRCSSDNRTDEYECLRRVPFSKLAYAHATILQEGALEVTSIFSTDKLFVPTIDRRFFGGRDPGDMILSGNFTNTLDSLLIGHNGNEGAMFLCLKNPLLFPFFDDSLDEYTSRDEMLAATSRIIESWRDVYKQIVDLAFDDRCRMKTRKLYNKMGKIAGDIFMACPQYELTDSVAKVNRNATIFYYTYNYRMKEKLIIPYSDDALHAEELPFVFGYPIHSPEEFTSEEIDFSKRLMDNWTHFVKTGRVRDTKWPPFNITNSSVNFNHIVFIDPKRSDYRSGPPENFCPQLTPSTCPFQPDVESNESA